ncbi:MAG: peptide deformylase [Spirochaetes bacterium]|nr:peptide deformylase [Spirochaetota bacterium]
MLKLQTYDNKVLENKSEEVKNIDKDLENLVNEMFKIMYENNGIGLAAVQVGVLKRLFVMDVPKQGRYVMINPVIKDFSKDKSIYEEGCLSVPGILAEVERPAEVTVEYTDLKGKRKTLKASGVLATCIQHENDHLDGVLFIDRIDPVEKLTKMREYRSMLQV